MFLFRDRCCIAVDLVAVHMRQVQMVIAHSRVTDIPVVAAVVDIPVEVVPVGSHSLAHFADRLLELTALETVQVLHRDCTRYLAHLLHKLDCSRHLGIEPLEYMHLKWNIERIIGMVKSSRWEKSVKKSYEPSQGGCCGVNGPNGGNGPDGTGRSDGPSEIKFHEN